MGQTLDSVGRGNRKPKFGFYAWPYFLAVTAVGAAGTVLLLACILISGKLSMTGALISALGFYLALAHYLSIKLHDRKGNALANGLLAFLTPTGSKTVLDVGSGTGRTSIAVARNSGIERIVGIDIYSGKTLSGNSPKRAYENARVEGVRDKVFLSRAEVLHIPFRDKSFDVATAGSVLHLFARAKREIAVAEMLRVLRDGGTLILIEWLRTVKAVLLYLLPAFFVFQTENHWRRLLEEHGLRRIKIIRIGNIGLIGGEKARVSP